MRDLIECYNYVKLKKSPDAFAQPLAAKCQGMLWRLTTCNLNDWN